MLNFLRRPMRKTLLSGATGYSLQSQEAADSVRHWVAQAIARTTMGSRDMWDSPDEQLRSALSRYEQKLTFVRDAAKDMAHGHMASSSHAKRIGNKAAMYGFGVVANWLMAIGNGDTALATLHRDFICALLDNHPGLLSSESIRTFGRAHGLP